MNNASALLQVQGLTFSHPGRPVFLDWSASVGAGATLVCGGESSGKTTLLRLLAAELPPSAGSLRLGQVALADAPQAYRRLYQPFHRQVNDWVHTHTTWKTFIHSCGSVMALIPDFLDAGFDIMNPVQCSAVNMDPHELKRKFGERVTFWGGGIDTQHVLPNGTPDDVRKQVCERIRIFGQGGGYVFNTIHNVQPLTPIDNLVAMYEAVAECGRYPLG